MYFTSSSGDYNDVYNVDDEVDEDQADVDDDDDEQGGDERAAAA